MKVSVLCFSRTGFATGTRLKEALQSADCEVLLDGKSKYIENSIEESHTEWTGVQFKSADVIIFVGACGIAVRSIVPFVKNKKVDPAVLVIDECGKYVISLLSGHIGGANEFTLKVADILHAEPVITTATDLHNTFAVDVFATKNNCEIFPLVNAKMVSAALLEGEKVGFYSDFEYVGKLPKGMIACDLNGVTPDGETLKLGVAVTIKKSCKPFEKTLYIVPRVVTLGMGCRRNKEVAPVLKAARQTIEDSGFFKESLSCIASIDLKKDEVGLIELSKEWKLPFVTYTEAELKSVQGEFSSSDFVRTITGVDNVCERSAVFAANNGLLVKEKYKGDGVTTALALRNWRVQFE